jgi:hypothetical protein
MLVRLEHRPLVTRMIKRVKMNPMFRAGYEQLEIESQRLGTKPSARHRMAAFECDFARAACPFGH